jgi:hypothetical protein
VGTFSKDIFTGMKKMYKDMGIPSDTQITGADIDSL